jgi:hypothetical protein
VEKKKNKYRGREFICPEKNIFLFIFAKGAFPYIPTHKDERPL